MTVDGSDQKPASLDAAQHSSDTDVAETNAGAGCGFDKTLKANGISTAVKSAAEELFTPASRRTTTKLESQD